MTSLTRLCASRDMRPELRSINASDEDRVVKIPMTKLAREGGIEPPRAVLETAALPVSYTRPLPAGSGHGPEKSRKETMAA